MSAKSEFKFENGQSVAINLTGQKGTVIGRADYHRIPPQYLIEYASANGDVRTDWFDPATISPA